MKDRTQITTTTGRRRTLFRGFPHGFPGPGSTEGMITKAFDALTILSVVAAAFPELTPAQRVLAAAGWWYLTQLYGSDKPDTQ